MIWDNKNNDYIFVKKTQRIMTDKQISLVKNSWVDVVAHVSEAGQIFYENFFALAPETKSLFTGDSKEQQRKLIMAVTLIFTKINRIENIKDEIKYLSKKHKGYGVKANYFESFGKAFVKMVGSILTERKMWNAEMQEAWTAIYNAVAQAMVENMKEA
ncbi:MAG: hypothetical protein EAZ55_03510 [Cytophagales bacterium]|nr:MAG: hypothetical protein EAZ55_03510 [Cytophagales bacterium]